MFDPWVGKNPWGMERLPTPVFLPREFHGLYSPRVRKESDMNEQLSLPYAWSFKTSIRTTNIQAANTETRLVVIRDRS